MGCDAEGTGYSPEIREEMMSQMTRKQFSEEHYNTPNEIKSPEQTNSNWGEEAAITLWAIDYKDAHDEMGFEVTVPQLIKMLLSFKEQFIKNKYGLENRKNIHHLLDDYDQLLRMEENTFTWNLDILDKKYTVQIKEQDDDLEN